MKTASLELIALLAGSRQFVMWETFTFTLADGSVVEYSTLDPDVVMSPAVAPPASTWLLDTFTGPEGTPLYLRAGEIGAVWTDDFGQYILNGSGAAYLPLNNASREVSASGVPVAGESDYFTTLEAVFPGASYFERVQVGVYNGEQDAGWFSEVRVDTETHTLFASGVIFGPDGTGEIEDTDTGLPASATPRELRVEVTEGRTRMVVKVDGIEIGSASAGAVTVSYPGEVFILSVFNNSAEGYISINKVEGGYL